MGAFSFNHYKNMNIGEGGAALTNDTTLFSRLLNYHDVGVWARDYGVETTEPYFVGTNARATELMGARPSSYSASARRHSSSGSSRPRLMLVDRSEW